MSITAAGSEILLPTLLFLVTLGSGFLLSRNGRPLKALIFNLHKLIALAATILMGLAIYRLLPEDAVQATVPVLLFAAGLAVVALFVTGALLSRGKPADRKLLTIHNVAPLVAVLGVAATILLL
jgi:hypothetical protein